MLLTFTDANNGQSFALNPKYIVGVFVGVEDANKDKTLIALSTGTVVVKETYLQVVGQVQSSLI
jgi:hypothetical protein